MHAGTRPRGKLGSRVVVVAFMLMSAVYCRKPNQSGGMNKRSQKLPQLSANVAVRRSPRSIRSAQEAEILVQVRLMTPACA